MRLLEECGSLVVVAVIVLGIGNMCRGGQYKCVLVVSLAR